jgi:hypothetical protein
MNPDDKRQWIAFLIDIHYNLGILIRRAGQGVLTDRAEALREKITDEMEALRT